MKKIAALVPTFLMFAPVALAQGDIVVPRPQGFRIENIGNLISAVISFTLIIAAILVFLYLVWGGIQWMTSGGDKAGVESARNRITAALLGLAIVAAAWAVIKIIETFFGVTIVGTITIPKPY